MRLLQSNTLDVRQLAYSPCGRQLIAGEGDDSRQWWLRLWDLDTGEAVWSKKLLWGPPFAVAAQTGLVASLESNLVRIMKFDGTDARICFLEQPSVTLAIRSDGALVATVQFDTFAGTPGTRIVVQAVDRSKANRIL